MYLFSKREIPDTRGLSNKEGDNLLSLWDCTLGDVPWDMEDNRLLGCICNKNCLDAHQFPFLFWADGIIFSSLPCNWTETMKSSSGPWNVSQSVELHFQALPQISCMIFLTFNVFAGWMQRSLWLTLRKM